MTPVQIAASTLRDGSACLAVAGELDVEQAPRLAAAVGDALHAGAATVVIDMAAVSFCDSTGIATLMRAYRAAIAGGGRLRVVNAHGITARVMKITGVLDVLTGT